MSASALSSRPCAPHALRRRAAPLESSRSSSGLSWPRWPGVRLMGLRTSVEIVGTRDLPVQSAPVVLPTAVGGPCLPRTSDPRGISRMIDVRRETTFDRAEFAERRRKVRAGWQRGIDTLLCIAREHHYPVGPLHLEPMDYQCLTFLRGSPVMLIWHFEEGRWPPPSTARAVWRRRRSDRRNARARTTRLAGRTIGVEKDSAPPDARLRAPLRGPRTGEDCQWLGWTRAYREIACRTRIHPPSRAGDGRGDAGRLFRHRGGRLDNEVAAAIVAELVRVARRISRSIRWWLPAHGRHAAQQPRRRTDRAGRSS
jgi:hypothetical protein